MSRLMLPLWNETLILARFTNGETGSSNLINRSYYNYLNSTGTSDGTATAVSGMHFTYCHKFINTGSPQVAYFGYDADYKPSAITIEGWFKVDSWERDEQTLVSVWGGTGSGFDLGFTATECVFSIKDASDVTRTASFSKSLFTTGEWHYIAASFDGATSMKLFLNNVEQDSVTIPTSGAIRYNGNYGVYFAGRPGGTPYFDGYIADVRITNKALRLFELHNTYNAQQNKNIGKGFLVESGTEGCWNFDQDYSSVVVDDAGSHSGSVVGTVTNYARSPIGTYHRYYTGSAGNRIEIPHSSVFNDFTSDLTWEVLCTPLSLAAYAAVLSKGWGNGITSDLSIVIFAPTATYLRAVVTATNGQTLDCYAPNVSFLPSAARELIYVAVTYEASLRRLNLFSDGVCIASDINESFNGSLIVNTSPVVFGGYYISGNTYYWNGWIDGVRFSTYAKTPNEIYDTYMGTLTKETF